jgi:hypothetical protein
LSGFYYSLNGNGSGGNNFVASVNVASLCSLVNAMQKEDKEKKTSKEGQEEKIVVGGTQEKGKKVPIAF